MIYIFSFLGYGDSLITGSIIENMRHTATSACLVGTEFTAETWEIMRIPLKPDVVLLSKTASFFKIKSSSLADIIHDFKIVRSWTPILLSTFNTTPSVASPIWRLASPAQGFINILFGFLESDTLSCH